MLAMFAPRPLAGQLVLITGASRGIGAALALAFAAEGCDLCLCARSAGELTQVQAECAELHRGGNCITIVADVGKPADCGLIVAQARNVFGRAPDVLINNAAATDCSGPFEQINPDDVSRLLRVNVEAPMLLARHLLPEMRQRRSGTIVNISSVCVPAAPLRLRVANATWIWFAAAAFALFPVSRLTALPRRRLTASPWRCAPSSRRDTEDIL